MLPKIELKNEDLIKLLSFTFLGDVVELADRLSFEIFKEIQEKNASYRLRDIDMDILNNAILTHNTHGIDNSHIVEFIRISSDREQFKRSIIYSVVSKDNNLKLKNYEITLIKVYKIFSIIKLNILRLYEKKK